MELFLSFISVPHTYLGTFAKEWQKAILNYRHILPATNSVVCPSSQKSSTPHQQNIFRTFLLTELKKNTTFRMSALLRSSDQKTSALLDTIRVAVLTSD